VEFFATKLDFKGEVEEEIKIGEGRFNNLEPMNSTYVYVNWLPEKEENTYLKLKLPEMALHRQFLRQKPE